MKLTKVKEKKLGRPTAYKKEYCEELIKYFDIEPSFETPIITTDKQGNSVEKIAFIAADLPTLAGFAKQLKVHRDTLHQWAKDHPEFSDAIKRAKECQEHILIQNGLRGSYNPSFAIFTAKNVMGWRDAQEPTVAIQQNFYDTAKKELKEFEE